MRVIREIEVSGRRVIAVGLGLKITHKADKLPSGAKCNEIYIGAECVDCCFYGDPRAQKTSYMENWERSKTIGYGPYSGKWLHQLPLEMQRYICKIARRG